MRGIITEEGGGRMKYKNVLLKKFGIREVNKMVKGEKIGDLWYVFFFGDWHYVPECDIEFNGKHLNKIKGSGER